MKILLADQIIEATLRRDELQSMFKDGASDKTRLDRQEGICLTLIFLQTYEQPFREFMRERKEAAA